jgi:HD-GYP domain-containing protein (c-di-GMP phosphodiesterase class II)
MNKQSVRDMHAGSYFNQPVYLDESYILLTLETPVTQDLLDAFADWDFKEVLSDGIMGSTPFDPAPVAATEGETPAVPETKDEAAPETQEHRQEIAKGSYNDFYHFTDDTFTRYVNKTELNVQNISYKVKELSESILQNRRAYLKLIDSGKDDKNTIVAHAVKSTIISLVLGTFFKFPAHKMIELGTAAMLHEIGMVRLPPQVYQSQKPLTDQERKAILAHPVIGFNILRNAQFPLSVCLAAFEHHERMDGSGYPRGLSGDKISAYAKIISAACSYEALTAIRPYKEAKESYAGIIDLLKNVGKQYDEGVIKGLVYSLSLYPVGSYVLLSDGRKAQVIDVNPVNPRCPVVAALGPGGVLDTNEIATSQTGIHIARPLLKTETGVA